MKIFDPCIFFLALGFLQGCGSSHDRATSAEEASHFFSDPKIEQCVDSLMQRMTLDEKIGQLVLYSSHFTTTGPTLPKNVEEAIRNGTCGNIFNAHVPSYNRELQRIAVEETRMGIPLLFGYDVIHGMKTIFPINLGMSCSWDIEGIKNSARVAAREAIAAGLNWTFSPMVDVTRDPRWGRVSEGSGEDTYLGSLIAAAMVEGYQGPTAQSLASDSTILACIKHFAAYGAPQAGRDYQTVDITDRTLREVYLPPYQAGIDAGVGSVMSAFNDIDAVPATASHYLMTDILRKEWGFDGCVITDYYMNMQVFMDPNQGIRAGNDLWLTGFTFLGKKPDLTSATSQQAARRACHNILYAVANANPINVTLNEDWLNWFIPVDVALWVVVLAWTGLVVYKAIRFQKEGEQPAEDKTKTA